MQGRQVQHMGASAQACRRQATVSVSSMCLIAWLPAHASLIRLSIQADTVTRQLTASARPGQECSQSAMTSGGIDRAAGPP